MILTITLFEKQKSDPVVVNKTINKSSINKTVNKSSVNKSKVDKPNTSNREFNNHIIEANRFNKKGDAAITKGDYKLAIKYYTEAIKLNPPFKLAYVNRGTAYDLSGMPNSAIYDYSMAIKLDPNDGKIYQKRGFVYRNIGKISIANEDFKKYESLK